MAAKKKNSKPAARKAKKKAPARRAKSKVRVKTPRPTAAPAGLKELDTEWRRFITKTVPDVPLTEVWEAPKGAPSTKTTIRQASLKKALKKAAKKSKKKATKKAAKKKAAKK
jgi:hypothetical protein